MIDSKHKYILSLNLKKLANRVDVFKIILILQNERKLLMLLCKCVHKQKQDIQRYSKTKNNSFLRILCYTIFFANYANYVNFDAHVN